MNAEEQQHRGPQLVLFDLDGTLADSAASILGSLAHALEVHGLPPLDPLTARSLLGPPLYASLPPIIGAANVAPVIAAYRARYATAMFDARAYPGVRWLLEALRGAGRRLAVATSKPERYATAIVENLGLSGFFETIGGDDLDGSLPTKALVIGSVLERLDRPHPSEVTMVGDRSHDVLGARAHGIACIAVTWGYATPGELAASQPARICTTVDQVAAALGVATDAAAQ